MSKWRTKMQIAQEMHDLFPQKYRNAEAPYKALHRAETGEYVDRMTASCIAEALATPLEELLESPPESTRLPQGPPSTASISVQDTSARRRSIPWIPALAVAFACGLLFIIYESRFSLQSGLELDEAAPAGHRSLPQHLAVVTQGELLQDLPDIAQQLAALPQGDQFSLVEHGAITEQEVLALVSELDVDGIVYLETRRWPRHTQFTVSLATHDGLDRIWSTALPTVNLGKASAHLAAQAYEVLSAQLGGVQAGAVPAQGTGDIKAVELYLEARTLLERSENSSVPSLNSAGELLRSSIYRAPDFALSHAALCLTQSSLYWVEDARPYLETAQVECELAREKLPHHPYVIAANAYLAIRDGAPGQALALAGGDEIAPSSVDIQLVAAHAHFALYQRDGSKVSLEEALSLLAQARLAEPGYWSPHFWYGTYSYYAGDIATALQALQVAADLNASEVVLANLGSIALCQDRLQVAQGSYERIVRDFPHNHLGPEMLGNVYHFLGRFEDEVASREKALKLLGPGQSPDIFQVYGALGDAYLQVGDTESAARNYHKALEILKRDEVRAIDRLSDQLAIALYRAQMAKIEKRPGEDYRSLARTGLSALEDIDADIPSKLMAARLAALIPDKAAASKLWAELVASCPVYARHPQYVTEQL